MDGREIAPLERIDHAAMDVALAHDGRGVAEHLSDVGHHALDLAAPAGGTFRRLGEAEALGSHGTPGTSWR